MSRICFECAIEMGVKGVLPLNDGIMIDIPNGIRAHITTHPLFELCMNVYIIYVFVCVCCDGIRICACN